jgi:hypothetical protein
MIAAAKAPPSTQERSMIEKSTTTGYAKLRGFAIKHTATNNLISRNNGFTQDPNQAYLFPGRLEASRWIDTHQGSYEKPYFRVVMIYDEPVITPVHEPEVE